MSIFQYSTGLAVLVAVLVGTGYSQNCMPPTTAQLESVIAAILTAEDMIPEITLSNFTVVCRAFAQQQDLLRFVSVVVEYTCTGADTCPSETAVEQIESGCQGESWSNNVLETTSSSLIRSQSPTATLTTSARDDCSYCASQALVSSQLGDYGSDTTTHCVCE